MNNFKKTQKIYVSLDKKNKWFACLNVGSYCARQTHKDKQKAINDVVGTIIKACSIKEFQVVQKDSNTIFHYNL